MLCRSCHQPNPDAPVACLHCGASLKQSSNFFTAKKGCLFALVAFFVLLAVPFVLMAMFLSSIGDQIQKEADKEMVVAGSGDDKIALINIDGVIVEKGSPSGFGLSDDVTSARQLRKVLKEIDTDPAVKVVLLRINSPGGSAVASEEIYHDLVEFKKTSNKKIVAYFSDLAASGGFYVAMAADTIIANPSNITGSIGVIISYLNFQDLAEKYGVNNIVYKSGPHKDIISEFREPTTEERTIMQSIVDDSYGNFVKVVSEGRKLPEARVRELADGRVYSAKQAKDVKLIDGLGTLDTAIDAALDAAGLEEASVVEFGQPSFWDAFLGAASSKFNLTLSPGLERVVDSKPGMKVMYLYTPY